jgi:hypothetical protein
VTNGPKAASCAVLLSALPSQSPVYLALWVCQVIDDRCDSAYLPEIDHAQCPPLKLALPRKVSSLTVLRTCQVATASITWRYRIWKLWRRCSGPNYTVAMLRAGYKTRSIALDPAHSILRIASSQLQFTSTRNQDEGHSLLSHCHRRPGFCCTSQARCWTIRHSRDAVRRPVLRAIRSLPRLYSVRSRPLLQKVAERSAVSPITSSRATRRLPPWASTSRWRRWTARRPTS